MLVLAVAVFALLGRAGGTSQAAPQALLLDPVGTFDHPTYLTAPPGDTQRLFVTTAARKRGRALKQSPRPGRRLAHLARVNLVVGKGR